MRQTDDPIPGAARLSTGTLALVYALVIVYLSLSPFRGWTTPEDAFAFLSAPLPRYITDFDLFVNVIAYVPLGFLCTVYFLRYRRPWLALLLGALVASLLSLAMETAQSYLPKSRVASQVDFACNALGALVGAALAEWLSRYKRLETSIANFRRQQLYPGRSVDVGIALLLLWVLSQVHPSIPLLGAGLVQHASAPAWDPFTWNPSAWHVPETPPSQWLPQTLAVALNFCGVGLFVSMLMRSRVRGLVTAIMLLVLAFLLKATAAIALLKPGAGLGWLEPGTSTGIALGTLLLLGCAGLPIRARIIGCGIAILGGALIAKLTGVYSAPRALLRWYDWPYGQILNFTGLTHTLNEIWPLLALMFVAIYFLLVRPELAQDAQTYPV